MKERVLEQHVDSSTNTDELISWTTSDYNSDIASTLEELADVYRDLLEPRVEPR